MADWKRMDRELPEMKEVCTVKNDEGGVEFTYPASRPVRVKFVEVTELTGRFFYDDGVFYFDVTEGPDEIIGEISRAETLKKITEWTYDN